MAVNIEEIKQALPVNRVIGHYLKGTQTLSGNQKYLSPFKKERTPSLMVSDSKGLWHDFSSGKGGDIFKFVKEYKGYNFIETLNELNAVFGLGLDLSRNEYDKEAFSRQAKIYEIHDKVADFCVNAIFEKKNGKQLIYVTQERALSEETVRRFKIGFSEKRNVEDYVNSLLKSEEYASVKKSDISLFNDKGVFMFSDRIMYPVRTAYGKIVAFSGGRTYPDQEPKYIHSTNNFVYEKSHNLMNLDKADFSEKEIFICEGNLDSIQLYNYGSKRSVALLGTAISEQQINLFVNRIEQATLLLDKDSAGTRATYEIARKLYAHGKRVYVFDMGKYKDVDEFLKGTNPAQGSIDSIIDEEKVELLSEMLIPMYVEKAEAMSIETKQDVLKKIKDLFSAIPERFDTFKIAYATELKTAGLNLGTKDDLFLEVMEDRGFPELTKTEKYDMTLRQIDEYERARKDHAKRLADDASDIEKNAMSAVDEDPMMALRYVMENFSEMADQIRRGKFGPEVKAYAEKALKSSVEVSEDFLEKTFEIDELLSSKPTELFERIKARL